MADLGRQSAFMPTVKCSSCGNQVEISMMGEHLCVGSAAAPEPTPPMPDLLGGAFSSFKNKVWGRPTPTVDTSAANQADVKPGSPTPMSASSGSRGISPKTPIARSLTGTSGDDYFAPAIAGSPPTSQPRRPGGYGGFGDESQDGDSTLSASPQKQQPNLLTRMNSIAPGPFDMNRRPSASKPVFAPARELTPEPIEDQLSSSVTSTGSGGSMAPPPRMPRKDGYGGFGPPPSRDGASPEPVGYGGLGKRSETFPNPARPEFDDAPARRPSVPPARPERFRSQRFSRRDTTRMVPPPRTSLIRPPTRNGDAPLINLADEFGVGNPYHSHSASVSSSNSGYSQASGSQPSQSSLSTSPARSTGSKMEPLRKTSDPSGMEELMNDLESSMESLKPVSSAPPTFKRQPPEALRLGPSGPSIAQPMPSPMLPPPTPSMDPAVQQPRSATPGHQRMRSRAGTKTRGNCRACMEPITGKSISSADGRLTGRYHKDCFVCTTCKEPFSSATFYVLGDRPYCEHHYHKLNGSLCGACNKGIEGQYLEDEAARKHHVGCFRCGDCGMVLRDGYFDVNGKAYCERDATRRVHQPMLNGPSPLGGPVERSIPEINAPIPMPTMAPRAGPGLPSGPNQKLNRPFGLPSGTRLMPGQALSRGALSNPMPRMEKRMTRLGIM